MKLAIIGGAGVRTPLLVRGLARSDLPIREVALYDADAERLDAIARVAERLAGDVRVTCSSTSADAITDASYVLLSIRVGGIERRARDEAAALALGALGQETVGPCGFAMALRTIPHAVAYADEVARLAPDAWVVNFTNPVGIVTQAMRTRTHAKVVGICDTPTELFVEAANALDLDPAECTFDYAGLNHLGWLREVHHRGTAQIARLFDRPELLAKVYRTPLFDPSEIARRRLLPTEYVFFYDHTHEAIANITRAGESRGAAIARMNGALFRDLAVPNADVVRVYENYLAARNGSYMRTESGATDASTAAEAFSALTGYDKIALAVVRAIHFDSGAVLPLNVSNRGTLTVLDADDVIEVPCAVDHTGPHARTVDPLPASVSPLVERVKDYERATVHAAFARSTDLACDALARNPLVESRAMAERLVGVLGPLFD